MWNSFDTHISNVTIKSSGNGMYIFAGNSDNYFENMDIINNTQGIKFQSGDNFNLLLII